MQPENNRIKAYKGFLIMAGSAASGVGDRGKAASEIQCKTRYVITFLEARATEYMIAESQDEAKRMIDAGDADTYCIRCCRQRI
jgi:hypothetical protein